MSGGVNRSRVNGDGGQRWVWPVGENRTEHSITLNYVSSF